MAGYSKTPLVKKLGIKPGFRLIILNPPLDYDQTLGELPEHVSRADMLAGSFDLGVTKMSWKKEISLVK